MGFDTLTNSDLENKEALRYTARDILYRSGIAEDSALSIAKKSIFDDELTPQVSMIKASNQININKSLSETLRYLKAQGHRKPTKAHVLGELWNKAANNENKLSSDSEIYNLTIDLNSNNIFAA